MPPTENESHDEPHVVYCEINIQGRSTIFAVIVGITWANIEEALSEM